MIIGIPIAKCYIRAEDPNNCLYLSDREFLIVQNKRKTRYSIDDLRQLHWTNKYLLLPLISGGIMISLSVFAHMNEILHPWFFLPLLLGGILLMYFGFVGSPALVLTFKNHQEQYLLRDLNYYLLEFTDFVNRYLHQKELPSYFIRLDKQQYSDAQKSGTIEITQPLEIDTAIISDNNKVTLKLDIQQLKGSVVYLRTIDNNGLKPHVTENLPLSAVS